MYRVGGKRYCVQRNSIRMNEKKIERCTCGNWIYIGQPCAVCVIMEGKK
jgi:hypothetical protein